MCEKKNVKQLYIKHVVLFKTIKSPLPILQYFHQKKKVIFPAVSSVRAYNKAVFQHFSYYVMFNLQGVNYKMRRGSLSNQWNLQKI